MNETAFLEEVTGAFAALIARGSLAVVASRYDPYAFGNALVILAGGRLRVRLVRDRGPVMADVSGVDNSEQWSPLQRVLRTFLGSAGPADSVLTPAEAAGMVDQYYDDLQSAFSPALLGRTRAKLAELAREAERNFIEQIKIRKN